MHGHLPVCSLAAPVSPSMQTHTPKVRCLHHQHHHSTLQELGVAPDAPTTRVKLAPLITPAAYHSYMSVFGTTMPTVHAVLCKHFERCSYDAHNLPNMILANPEIVKVLPNMSVNILGCV